MLVFEIIIALLLGGAILAAVARCTYEVAPCSAT